MTTKFKISKNSNKYKFYLLFSVILIVGIFLRSYQFSNLMHFELDQARDAGFISKAIQEGISKLPVLGPRAAGTSLKLGPAFYYLEYISALIFGDDPRGHAMHVLIFSILSIPLMYFFSRRYFNVSISLILMAFFSISLFLIIYSRFSWNPNLLPFFMLLSSYAILRFCDKEEKRKSLWFFISVLSVTICTQLHFIAFFAAPAIFLLFLGFKRPRLLWSHVLIGLMVVLFLYLPFFINDVMTHGANIKAFKEAVLSKTGDGNHSIIEKLFQNVQANAQNYYIVITGDDQVELPQIEFQKKVLNFFCVNSCNWNIKGLIALVIYLTGIALLIINFITEKNIARKNFLLLVLIWFSVSFFVFVPIAYKQFPRFYLLVAPISIIFLGFIIEKIFNNSGKFKNIILFLLIGSVFFLNFKNIWSRYNELRSAATSPIRVKNDRILREKTRVTLQQQNMIIDYIESKYKEKNYPVFIKSESYYGRSFKYHLKRRKIIYDSLRTNQVYEKGIYFVVYRTGSEMNESNLQKYFTKLKIKEIKSFGTLTVYYMEPIPGKADALEKDFSKVEKNQNKEKDDFERFLWSDFFSKEK